MENILILDTETTGLDASKSKVVEIAGILFNVPTRSIISQASCLIRGESNDAYEVNRIEVETLKKVPETIEVISRSLFMEMMQNADAIVAHNAEFDKRFIEAFCPQFAAISKSKKWICTRNDVIWPVRKGIPLNLVHICVDLGVPIVNAHRALADCGLLVEALQCLDEIDTFLDKSGKGRVIYHAQVNYEQRQLVKDAGFLWDNAKKVWHAKLTPEQAQSMPFTCYPAENACVNQ